MGSLFIFTSKEQTNILIVANWLNTKRTNARAMNLGEENKKDVNLFHIYYV